MSDTRTGTPPAPEPFALALREAIEASGLGLTRLQYRLAQRGVPVSLATLSYWQSGRRRPERQTSLRALGQLESVLGLRQGELVALIGPPRPRGRWKGEDPGPRALEAWWPDHRAIASVLGSVDTAWDDALERISHHDRVTVGPDRGERVVTTRQVLRAHRPGADRWVLLYHLDEHGRSLPQIRPLRGCRLGVVHADPRIGLLAAELLFPRPLSAGETIITEHAVRNALPYPIDGNYERRLRLGVREYVIEVEFDPCVLPRSCEVYVVTDDADFIEQAVPLFPDQDGRVHSVALDVAPCRYGVRWTW